MLSVHLAMANLHTLALQSAKHVLSSLGVWQERKISLMPAKKKKVKRSEVYLSLTPPSQKKARCSSTQATEKCCEASR